MKLYLDIGDVEAARKAYDTGLIDGVTTDPSHIAKTGKRSVGVVKEMCSVVPGPMSVGAGAETAEDLMEKAQRIAGLAPE